MVSKVRGSAHARGVASGRDASVGTRMTGKRLNAIDGSPKWLMEN